ncbi:hypothetical protein ALC57_01126 [Trachymyrmex cornetzi]|uniref:Uncharacterized protein n=1 Tax=Trachymyrmex cornetzi TaxID=471704 RepID=A0A151JQN6_9HYME|nr:hypothetical protein ALC57_01126 [Trachymyrmex cornetzi]
MNARSTSDKSEINGLYRTAIENRGKSKHDNTTIHTSTPASSKTTPKQIDFSLDESEIDKDSFKTSIDTLVSNASGDTTIQPVIESRNTPMTKRDKIIANPNPFATLKYAVEAVPFFDGKNIPLTYFIEGCEEAMAMLPAEAESQFTNIIRTRIVGEARPRNLNVHETVADALSTERELSSMTDLRQGPSNIAGKITETCQICYKEGHSASNCRKVTNLGTEILLCQIYKKRGYTGSGPNIIKENFISRDNTVNHNNILKLNGINEYPVYTLGEITLPLFENKVTLI